MVYRSKHPLYSTWKNMMARCENPRSPNYGYYGAKGIRVCERWRKFEAWVEDMGPRAPGSVMVRDNLAGDYEPGNCRWGAKGDEGWEYALRMEMAGAGGVKTTGAMGRRDAEEHLERLTREAQETGMSCLLYLIRRRPGGQWETTGG